ncbi:MAG: GyrI-like domain-containing protein [Phycisphaerae bacterium]|jgi:hypothetical protein|nr:GyrI-like domain-containing protein [Phycisphaerae bacterium]
MGKIDYKKEFSILYKASSKTPHVVDVHEMNFLMVDGQGDPNSSQDFQDAVEALYSLSFTLKFAIKLGPTAVDYGVPPLEGLWWADDIAAFKAGRKDEWKWTLMIMQPEFVTPALLNDAIEKLKAKKDPTALSKVRFEPFCEGRAAQIMHIGPYSEEGPTIEKLHAFIRENGCEVAGKHHEIYLGDPRRAAPEKLRTIVRQPMA